MRRIRLYMDEGLSDARSARAARLGASLASSVGDAVRTSLAEELQAAADPVDSLIGYLDIGPYDDIDAVVYGNK